MNIAKIMVTAFPDKRWVLNGDSYDGLLMLDGSDKPTLSELEAVWPTVQADQQKALDKNILESKIQAELRIMAIERLEAKGEITEAGGIK
jgi:hypothetical protein